MDEEQKGITVPLVYVGAEDIPILFVNQFVVQHHATEFYLTIGQVQPPILLGSPEERTERAKQLGYVPVKVVARLGLTHERMLELIHVLQVNVKIYEGKKGGAA